MYNVLNDHVTLWKPEPMYQLPNPRDRFIRNLENPKCEINVCRLVSMKEKITLWLWGAERRHIGLKMLNLDEEEIAPFLTQKD